MWLENIPVRFASTPTDLVAEFDSTVALVCLSQSLSDDDLEEIQKYVLTRNPFCQIVLLSARGSSIPSFDWYDAVLQRPISKTELRDTLAQRLTYGVYSFLLHEFYSLNATINSVSNADTVEDSDNNIDLNQYEERLQEIQPQLKQLQTELCEEDIREISRTIYRHKGYLTEPSAESDQTQTSKHHPDECPMCNLTWGHDYENELGNGFIALGAGVWKCTKCDEISHGVNGSQQRIV